MGLMIIIGYKKHLTLLCCLLLVLSHLPGLFCTCLSSSREKRDAASKSTTYDTRIVFPLLVNSSSSDKNDTVDNRLHHRVRTHHQAALDTIKYGNLAPDHPNRIKSHRKRCRYSDDEFEALKSGVDNNVNFNSNPSGSIQSYYISKAKLNPNPHHIKQPKVRDQFHNHHHRQHGSSDSANNNNNNNIEREILLVNTGDTINLTCHISTTEVDWHFKDRNLTTTVLSYGLQLQVAQPVLFEPTVEDTRTDVNYDVIGDDYQSPDDLFGTNDKASSNRLQQRNTAYSHHSPHMFKYRVSSDHELTHVLTVYVQGPQDEGSYQCIDSKSESPIKKTIQVYLSKLDKLDH